MDPISDRVKDICIIFCSASGAMSLEILLNEIIQVTAFLSVSFWMLYVYVVDAHLNPARKKHPDHKREFILDCMTCLFMGYFMLSHNF